MMWLPFSWIIRHWIGVFHAIACTALIVVADCVWPEHRFAVMPLMTVGIGAITIVVLERRWRAADAAMRPGHPAGFPGHAAATSGHDETRRA